MIAVTVATRGDGARAPSGGGHPPGRADPVWNRRIMVASTQLNRDIRPNDRWAGGSARAGS